MFEVVPLAEVIAKLDEEAARKTRDDSARKEESPGISAGAPHRTFNSGKNPGRVQVQWTRAESEINHG